MDLRELAGEAGYAQFASALGKRSYEANLPIGDRRLVVARPNRCPRLASSISSLPGQVKSTASPLTAPWIAPVTYPKANSTRHLPDKIQVGPPIGKIGFM